MSKKKNNNAVVSQSAENENSVIDAEVVETPDAETPVAEGVETPIEEASASDVEASETPADEVPVDSTPDAEETEAPVVPVPDGDTEGSETPVDAPATGVEVSENPADPAPDAEKPETPADDADKAAEEEKPEDEEPKSEEEAPAEEKLEQNAVDADIMNKELMISYKVRFAFNQSSKKYAAQRNMTLFNMIDLFMTNRQGFVGCTEQKDFDHIKDFVLHNPIIYKYQEFKLEGRKQFIERLELNTDYVINHLK